MVNIKITVCWNVMLCTCEI